MTLKSVEEAKSDEQRAAAWNELLDPNSIFHLLYCLSIVNNFIRDNGDEWLAKFLKLGGYNQFLKCLAQLNITEIDSMLKLKCLQEMIDLISKNSPQLLSVKNQSFDILVVRCLKYIEMICEFTIKNEQKRGLSFDGL